MFAGKAGVYPSEGPFRGRLLTTQHHSLLLQKLVNKVAAFDTNKKVSNEGKLAASFCRQVAVFLPGMFCNFYLVKNHKIAYNLATTEARKK